MANQAEKEQPVELKLMRASASVPSDLYATLQALARKKKVSVAWIIRDALDRYVSEQWPLLTRTD